MGSTGQFDVLVDGRLIFSKREAGRFPDDNEVEKLFELMREGKELPPPAKAEKHGIRELLSRWIG